MTVMYLLPFFFPAPRNTIIPSHCPESAHDDRVHSLYPLVSHLHPLLMFRATLKRVSLFFFPSLEYFGCSLILRPLKFKNLFFLFI